MTGYRVFDDVENEKYFGVQLFSELQISHHFEKLQDGP